jgi:hypothetical protein
MTQQAQLQEFYRDQRLKRELQKDELYARHGIAWIKCIRSIINHKFGNIVSKSELLELLDNLTSNDSPTPENHDIYKTYTAKDVDMLCENDRLVWSEEFGLMEK